MSIDCGEEDGERRADVADVAVVDRARRPRRETTRLVLSTVGSLMVRGRERESVCVSEGE